MRSRIEVRKPRRWVHQRLAVIGYFIGGGVEDKQLVFALPKRQFHGFFKAFFVLSRHFQAVDHQFHSVILVAVELHAECNFTQFAIDTHVDIAFLSVLLKKVFVVAFAILHQWRQNVNFLAVVLVENQRKYLFNGVFHHTLA